MPSLSKPTYAPAPIPAAASQATHFAMGTVMSHKLFGPYSENGLAAAVREIARIEALLSRFIPTSDVSRVNRSAGEQREKIGPETFEVLSKAAAFSRDWPGCFDVTCEPLVQLWKQA